jgi:hypothetical protein
MTDARAAAPRPLPGWLVWIGSLGIAFHFFALSMLVLSAPSGPWPTPFGSSTAFGPKFADLVNQFVTPNYLEPLRMTHNYHFITNRPELPTASFEIVLKDKDGTVKKRLSYPDPDANPWVRFRERLLAIGLADDEPVQIPRGEIIPAAGKKMPSVSYWDAGPDDKIGILKTSEIHLAPKNRDVYRPRDWSLQLARSYMRHALRQEGLAKAELIRHVRPAIMSAMVYVEEAPPGTFTEMVNSFGEQQRR